MKPAFKVILLFIFSALLFSFSTDVFAKPNAKTKPQSQIQKKTPARYTKNQMLIKKYFQCFEQKNKPHLIKNCVNKVISPNAPKAEKDRLSSWLIVYNFELAGFKDCSAKKLKESRYFYLSTSIYVCAHLKNGPTKKEAIFFLEDGKTGQKYLRSFLY